MNLLPVIPQDLRTTASPTFANLYDSGLTSGRVTYAGASGLLQDSTNLTFDGTNLDVAGTGDFGTLTIGSGSITDSSGAISFGDEYIASTGHAAFGNASSVTENIVIFGFGSEINPGNNRNGMYLRYDIAPTIPSTFIIRGAVGQVGVAGSSSQSGYVSALQARVFLQGTSTVTGQVSGVQSDLNILKTSGTVSEVSMFRGSLSYTGGTCTAAYGLLLPDIIFGATNYAIKTGLGQCIFGDDIVIGSGSAATDYTLTFDGETNDGVITWMEDEDYFQFSDDIFLTTGEAVMFEATTTKLQYGNAGDLDVYTPANKTLELQTAVYKDINISGALLVGNPTQVPGTDQFVDSTGTDTGIETFAFAIDEGVHGGFELQHDYKEGTDLNFHVHWQGIAAPTGTDNVQWRLTYIVSRDDTVLAAATPIDSPDTAIDTQYECYRTDFAAITGTNFKIGDQFMFSLERVDATGDAYAGDALIFTAGIHYQIDTLGSRQIGTK